MRKYFIQPNILVLISFKLSQLEDIKYLELSDFYKHDKQTFTPDRLRDMVDKYMVKLIPHSHRIFMPQSEDYHGKPLEVKLSNTKKDSKETATPAPLSFPSVRQAIPQLIFWKTRYLFYNAYAHESYIVPANLRELRQLIKLLVTLPDYRVYGENANGEENYNYEADLANGANSFAAPTLEGAPKGAVINYYSSNDKVADADITSGAITLILPAVLGIPVSTTHTITGSIIGTGLTRGIKTVKWITAKNIVWAWILTIPAVIVVSGTIYLIMVNWFGCPVIAK